MSATLSPSTNTGAQADKAHPASSEGPAQVALVGNPNAGKTTLFNALTGIRGKTANFPGTTLEIRRGAMHGTGSIELIDLPGLYSLDGAEAEERVALNKLLGRVPGHPGPQGVILLLDATNLVRNLYLASQVLELGLPTVVVLTMIDVADKRGIEIDRNRLGEELGCPVVAVTARSGRGVTDLEDQIRELAAHPARIPQPQALPECSEASDPARFDWAEGVGARCLQEPAIAPQNVTAVIDRFLTHRVFGIVSYLSVMLVVFYLIFVVAQIPMGWIEAAVEWAGGVAAGVLPEGQARSLIVNGMIGGVGSVLVFLPQIALIFFCLSLMEDLGYMARAALVMDRVMRKVGLPGKAFVPMLSAHACAIPAIMSTRIIESPRDRLVTILILPLLTCSARLPVYAMITSLVFMDRPGMAALAFTGAYGLGLLAAVGTAMLIRHTIQPGSTQPLVIELPDYRRPSLKQALLTTYDRARLFIRKAGTIILAISIVLWWLSTYPTLDVNALPAGERAQLEQALAAEQAAAAGPAEEAAALTQAREQLEQSLGLEYSFAGRMGHAIEPVIRPLGFDWKIGVGVISSFAAREVLVSTLVILYGQGSGDDPESAATLYERMREDRREDGRAVFSVATCISMLVFFVLAMQCLPTQVVVRRETGTWKWPLLQFSYMTVLAYVSALIVYQTLAAFGWG